MKYAFCKTDENKIILGSGDASLLPANNAPFPWKELTKEEYERAQSGMLEGKTLFVDEENKLQIREND